jgi:uncharacterized protein YbjT (DUF2867 family)
MKLVVFGATGSIGRQVVSTALAEGHLVTAFARAPESLAGQFTTHGEALRFHAGNVLDPDAVAAAVAGHEGAIVALGAGARGGLRAPGTANVLRAMQGAGVRRLVALSTLGAGDSRVHLNFLWKYVMFGLLLRRAMADHEAQEALIRESDTDWTIVRPAAFTDEPEVPDYFHGDLSGKALRLELPRANIARFMLGELVSSRYLHQSPGLSR